jgi:uncharacterized alpha-E superfamily protein/hemerythrin-like domain-containing protein
MAEAMYWCGRYVERSQALARTVLSYERLALDLPGSRSLDLRPLLPLIGRAATGQSASRRDLLEALVLDVNNTSSVLGALRAARENMRQARVLAPPELWTTLSQLHARVGATRSAPEAAMLEVLEETLSAGSRFQGERQTGMTRDPAHAFLDIGCQLERADMLLRNLAALLPALLNDGWEHTYDDVRWNGVLHALGVHSIYRRCHHHRVDLVNLLELVLVNPSCPRSVAHCLGALEAQLRYLPRPGQPRDALSEAERLAASLNRAPNGQFVPELDLALDSLDLVHRALERAYFPEQEPTRSPQQEPSRSTSARDPFEHLGREHVRVDAVLRVLDELSLIAQRGAVVERGDLHAITLFFTEFGERSHHEKEESILVPQLVAHGFDWHSGPLAAMRREHRQEHYFIRVLTQLATQRDDWSVEERRNFVTVATEFSRFLRAHMDHERRDLFEQASRALPSHAKNLILAAFGEFDSKMQQLPGSISANLDELLGKYGVASAPEAHLTSGARESRAEARGELPLTVAPET